MSQYQQFIFDSYDFDKSTKTLSLHYAIDDAIRFTETYHFDFEYTEYDDALLDQALQLLFFLAGVSYYKTYIPPEIVVRQGTIDTATAAFLGKTYQRGLGEFFYVNKLDPNTPVTFPVNGEATAPLEHNGTGKLVSIGGGKDSLVSVELLRQKDAALATWSLNHRPQLTPLVERIGLPHFWVDREWDTQLLELRDNKALGAYNGHVPISSIFAAAGVITAILAGKRDVVFSNEQSANEPNLHYQGMDINHQYSKTQEFERDFQACLRSHFGESIRYYSFLRPFSELRISELFAKIGFDTYKDTFSSCNRAFVHESDHLYWCGECPKCAFVYMALTPFVPADQLGALWNGKNLLLDPNLESLYRMLLGIEGDKPLECVGEVKESRAAMRLAQDIYPALKEKYQFTLPDGYDFRSEGSDEMPGDVRAIFEEVTAPLK